MHARALACFRVRIRQALLPVIEIHGGKALAKRGFATSDACPDIPERSGMQQMHRTDPSIGRLRRRDLIDETCGSPSPLLAPTMNLVHSFLSLFHALFRTSPRLVCPSIFVPLQRLILSLLLLPSSPERQTREFVIPPSSLSRVRLLFFSLFLFYLICTIGRHKRSVYINV